MSLLLIEGFDHYASADLPRKGWQVGSSYYCQIAPTAGRRGGGAFCVASSYDIKKTFGGTATTVIAGVAATLMNADQIQIFDFMESAISHVSIYWSSADGKFRAYRNGVSTFLGQSTVAFTASSAYRYIEAKVYIHGTAGTVEIRVDGATVLSLTGQNTKNGGSGYCDTLRLAMYSGNTTTYFDDLYLCDAAGAAPHNDFLGDCRVDTLLPSGAGTYGDLVASADDTPHRYWRLWITDTQNSSPPYLTELEMRSTIGGTDQTGSGTAMATSGTASAAFDNSTTQWSGPSLPCYIGYDFGAGVTKIIREVALTSGSSGMASYMPTVFLVQWSDDGVTWMTRQAVTTLATWNASETRVFSQTTDPYQMVDDAIGNMADYISGSTLNAKSTFAMGDVAALAATVFGVQVNALTMKDDGGIRGMAAVVKSGSALAQGATIYQGAGGTYAQGLWATDPNTSAAWTESSVNALEAGVKITL